MRKQAAAGHQVYVVCPVIEENDEREMKAALKMYRELSGHVFADLKVGLLHGRLESELKEQVMRLFQRGQLNILVATTVIEVGVDVPNATVMVIQHAERFGLSQLHQLRGRIGRGEHKSTCILLSSNQTTETSAKLAVLERTTNGFEVAEADWGLRGPGDVLGTAQSGLPALKIGDLKRDASLMRRARVTAIAIFEIDPRLELPENQRFRRLIVEQGGKSFSHVS